MLPEINRFNKWLRRRSPHASTHVHYTGDLQLFFAWAGKPPSAITLHDVDTYVERCQRLGHAIATVNRRLEVQPALLGLLRALVTVPGGRDSGRVGP